MSSLATAPAASGQTNGIYKALVVSAADPHQRRRITARIPQILGPQTSPWCTPVDITSPVPNPGDFVWVMFEGGDLTKPVYLPANSASFSLPPEEPGTKVLPAASQAERDALAAEVGQVVYRSDLDYLQVFNGSTWRDYIPSDANPIGRMQTWLATGPSTVGNGSFVLHAGGFTVIAGDHLPNDGWTGVVYTGSGIWTCQQAGRYAVEFGYNWQANTGGRRILFIYKNQSTPTTTNALRRFTVAATSGTRLQVARAQMYLVPGDTFRLAMYQSDSTGLVSLSATTTEGPVYDGVSYAQYLEVLRMG